MRLPFSQGVFHFTLFNRHTPLGRSIRSELKNLNVLSRTDNRKSPSADADGPSVGEDLFFRAVARRVFLARQSLTTVFGMGTGGPSEKDTPTESEAREA